MTPERNHAEDGDLGRPEDRADSAGLTHSGGHGSARQVREFRMSSGDRVGNAISACSPGPVSGRPTC